MNPDGQSPGTDGVEYTERLMAKQNVWWKRLLRVQAPYQWNLRRQHLGRTMDVGCGIGRNLATLEPGSIGIDHNEDSVAVARRHGRAVMTTGEFFGSEYAKPESFDGMLLAHVIEHLDADDALTVVGSYLPFLRPGGKVFFVCPQERGYASDATHVRFTDGEALVRLSRTLGLVPGRPYSFPFPRALGKAFVYNEFCLLAHKPASA